MRKVLLFILLLTAVAPAQTLFIDSHEVNYRIVDGKQVVNKADLAPIFPEMADEEGTIEVEALADHPDARVTKRDGVITRIKYYNSAAAAIYKGVKKDLPTPDNGPSATAAGTSPVRLQVGSRRKIPSPRPDYSAHIYSVTIVNGGDAPLKVSSGSIYVLDQEGAQYRCETRAEATISAGGSATLTELTFNVPKRNTVKSMHLGEASSRL